jgi:hypothetical protein
MTEEYYYGPTDYRPLNWLDLATEGEPKEYLRPAVPVQIRDPEGCLLLRHMGGEIHKEGLVEVLD